MKKISLLLVACLFSGVACWPFSGDEAQPDMTLRREGDGKVEILRGSETIKVNGSDVPIEPGDIVRTYKGALGQVALEGERVAWVGGTGQVVDGAPDAQMRIIDTTSVESETGTVLAEADESMKVRFGDATATTSDGVFRVDRRAGSARAGSLAGTVRLAAPGEPTLTLPRLYEASSTANDFRASQPYRLDPEDPFDKQRLESIIDLEGQLGQLSAGFVNQLGNGRPTLGYFRVLSNGKDVSAMRPYLKRPTIEQLLGFTVATNTDDYPFPQAIRDAFRHRDAGGSWGVVAAILRSQPRALLADLEDIIVGSGAVADGGGGSAQFDLAAAEAAQTGEAPAPPGPGPDQDLDDPIEPDRPDDPDPDDPDDPDPDDEEEPAEDCTSGIDCTQEEVRERIVPQPDPSPTDFINP